MLTAAHSVPDFAFAAELQAHLGFRVEGFLGGRPDQVSRLRMVFWLCLQTFSGYTTDT